MILSWDDVAAISGGVAVGSVPVLLAYLLNGRSARKQLAREQEYSRRREAYDLALLALRKQRDLTQTYQAFLRFQSLAKAADTPAAAAPSQGTTANVVPDEFVLYVSKLFAILGDILTGSQAPSIPPGELFKLDSGDRQKVLSVVVDSTIRGLARATLDVQSACQTLLLADGSEEFLERAQNLAERIAEPFSNQVQFVSREYDWETIASEITDLNLLALQDLKSILGEEIDIELSRKTPPRVVHASQATQTRRKRASESKPP